MTRWSLILFLCLLPIVSAFGQRSISVSFTNGTIVAPPDVISDFGADNGIPQTNSTTSNFDVPMWLNGIWVFVPTNNFGGGGGSSGPTSAVATGSPTVKVATNSAGGTNTYTLTAVQSTVTPGSGTGVSTSVAANGATNYQVNITAFSTFNNQQFFSSGGNTNLQTNQTLGHLDLVAGAAQGTNLFTMTTTNDPRGEALPNAASNKFVTSASITGISIQNTNFSLEPQYYTIGAGNGAGGGGTTGTGAPFNFVVNAQDQNPSSPIPEQADLYLSSGTGNLWVAGNITNFGEILTSGDVKAENGFSTQQGVYGALGDFTTIVAGNLLPLSALKLTANTTLEQTTPTHVSLLVGGNDGTNHQETTISNTSQTITFTGPVAASALSSAGAVTAASVSVTGAFVGSGGGLTNLTTPVYTAINSLTLVGGASQYIAFGSSEAATTVQTNAYMPSGQTRTFSSMSSQGGAYPLTGTNILFVLQKNGADTLVSNVMGFTGTTNVSTGAASVNLNDNLNIRIVAPAAVASLNANVTTY